MAEYERYDGEEYARYQAEEAEKRRQAAIAGGQPLETNIGSRTEEGFFNDSRIPISAYFLDPALAGTMTDMEKAAFYDQMRRAEAQGQDIYGQQQNFANALYQRSQGLGGPSIAEMQLQQSLNANRQDAARTLAGAGRGINPALARRLLMQQQGSLNQTAAGQAAILRAQEQQAAQTAYGSQLNNMRATETSLYGTSGQLGLNQAKAQSELFEAQKARDLQLAIENQRAAQKASGQASSESEGQANRDATQRATATKAAGEAAVEAAKAIKNTPPTPAAHGGIIRKYAEGGKINAAMGKLTKMDNEKNDVIPAMLSPGEIVIPRSIVSAPNAPMAAHRFVEALLANKGKKDAKMLALKAALGKK